MVTYRPNLDTVLRFFCLDGARSQNQNIFLLSCALVGHFSSHNGRQDSTYRYLIIMVTYHEYYCTVSLIFVNWKSHDPLNRETRKSRKIYHAETLNLNIFLKYGQHGPYYFATSSMILNASILATVGLDLLMNGNNFSTDE